MIDLADYTVEKRNADASEIFTSAAGERYFLYLYKTHVNRLSYVKGDVNETARREGNKEVVLDIFRHVGAHRKRPETPGPESETG